MCFRSQVAAVALVVAALTSTGSVVHGARTAEPEAVPPVRLVVMPVLDLTGSVAPSALIEAMISDRLQLRGFDLVPARDLDAWFAEHRIRFTGGLGAEALSALRERTAASAVLFTNVDQFGEDLPPRVALTARAVDLATGRIVWTGAVARSGRDRPGLLGRGVVEDVERLADDAVGELFAEFRSTTLATLLGPDAPRVDHDRPRPRRDYRPHRAFRAPALTLTFDGPTPPRVAVLPFFNGSPRADAGDLAANLYVHELVGRSTIEVVEPGIVRDALLRGRVIQDQGLSFSQISNLQEMLDVDLVVTGRVLTFSDPGGDSVSRVAFSVWVFDTHTREVVWSAYSASRGDDGVVFFDRGRAWSARALLAGMIRASAHAFLEGR